MLSVVQQECQRLDAPLLIQGRDYDVAPTGRGDILYTGVHGTSYRLPHVSLYGRHQIQNAAVALAAAEVIYGTCPQAWALGLSMRNGRLACNTCGKNTIQRFCCRGGSYGSMGA